MKEIDNSIFINFDKILSYGSFITFVLAERGVGKSYGAKKFIINHYKKTGKQTVYLRRYNKELQEALMKKSIPIFFDQIKDEFPNDKLSNSKELLYYNKEVCGYAVALSTSNILKSSTFENVDTIIYDEFIIDKGTYHYLQNETTAFFEIIETIFRLRNGRVLLLGNAISITNPYFVELNLSLPYNSEYKIFKKDNKGNPLLTVYYGKNLKYRETKKLTRFGQLIEGTKYGKYAIDNEFLRDSKAFLGKKTKDAKFFFILKLNNKMIGVWIDYKQTKMFLSYDYDPNCPIIFSINSEDHDEHTILIKVRTSSFFHAIIDYYRSANLYFENQQLKNQIMSVLSKYLTY